MKDKLSNIDWLLVGEKCICVFVVFLFIVFLGCVNYDQFIGAYSFIKRV